MYTIFGKDLDSMQDLETLFSHLEQRLDSFISSNGIQKNMPVLRSISKKNVSTYLESI